EKVIRDSFASYPSAGDCNRKIDTILPELSTSKELVPRHLKTVARCGNTANINHG
ncbi:hypothetical protein HBH89_254490, partial [Parastagonospora nodorum]